MLSMSSVLTRSQTSASSIRMLVTTCVHHAERVKPERNFDAQSILEDEKKGIFRVLTIGQTKDSEKRLDKRKNSFSGPPPAR